jgi:hypothetical protein
MGDVVVPEVGTASADAPASPASADRALKVLLSEASVAAQRPTSEVPGDSSATDGLDSAGWVSAAAALDDSTGDLMRTSSGFDVTSPNSLGELRMRRREIKQRHRTASTEVQAASLFNQAQRANEKPPPSVKDARAFPQLAVEPKFVWGVDHKHGLKMRRLQPPGQSGGEAFPLKETTIWELSQFGPAIGLLFHTIRGLGIALFVSAIALTPVCWHYTSEEYSRYPFKGDFRIRGSAVCLDIDTINATDSQGLLVAATRSNCHFTWNQAMWDCVCVVAIFVAVLVLNRLLHLYDVRVDSKMRTHHHLSVVLP